jgi:hypothetical protein
LTLVGPILSLCDRLHKQGGEALTPVDMFTASAGRAEPYLNLFFRQPFPGNGFFPNHVEAIVDLRNLLAQRYVPVLGNDGHTVYLVQSARAVSGGVAFTFSGFIPWMS